MKTKLLMMATAFLLSLTSCGVNFGNNISNRISPSDNIVKAKYQFEAFDKIDNHVVGNIRIVQSKGDSRVTLSAPDNYIDLYEFTNEGGELKIRFTRNSVNIDTEDVDIIIYTPTLNVVRNSGASEVRLDSLTTEAFEVYNSGVGSFFLNQLNVKNLDVKCTGVGSIELSGQTEKAEYSCTGVGSINAQDLKAYNVKAQVTGVGSIQCYASEAIEGGVTGVDSLRYAGRPAHRKFNNPKIGSITEL